MNKQQILQLKRQAHKLKPVVIIGGNGLTKSVSAEIECALEAHELIKIRINAADRDERESLIQTITATHGSTLIDAIGHVVIVYRKHTNNDSQR